MILTIEYRATVPLTTIMARKYGHRNNDDGAVSVARTLEWKFNQLDQDSSNTISKQEIRAVKNLMKFAYQGDSKNSKIKNCMNSMYENCKSKENQDKGLTMTELKKCFIDTKQQLNMLESVEVVNTGKSKSDPVIVEFLISLFIDC